MKVKHLFPKWDVEMKMIQLKQNTAQTIDTMWNYARCFRVNVERKGE